VEDPRVDRLLTLARAGRLSRRRLLETGLRLGLASPAILSLIEAAPRSVAAAPANSLSVVTASSTAQEESSGTFTVLLTAGTEDIDPHYSYSTLSSTVALAVYEMLLILKGDSTDEFEPMLAESWEISEDQSTYTFTLYPDVMFQDGTPANAQVVKDSYTRWIELDGSPVNVITRFCDSPDKMEVVDETTLRFNLGSPQPLFLAAMASAYGPSVISPKAISENATEADPYAHEWAKAAAGSPGSSAIPAPATASWGMGVTLFQTKRFGRIQAGVHAGDHRNLEPGRRHARSIVGTRPGLAPCHSAPSLGRMVPNNDFFGMSQDRSDIGCVDANQVYPLRWSRWVVQ
jgi:ABC-type transport system substrate-binding protein